MENFLVDDISNINKKVGKKIRTVRKIKMLTQEELGYKTGLSYKFIGEIERGIANPSLDSLFKISNGLGIDIIDIFPNKDESKSSFSYDSQLIIKAVKLLNKALNIPIHSEGIEE
jgi:transcriptional regulator with XRE-family HTH domain